MFISGDTRDTSLYVLGEVSLKLNLFLSFYFECLVELAFFCVKRFISVDVTLWENL